MYVLHDALEMPHQNKRIPSQVNRNIISAFLLFGIAAALPETVVGQGKLEGRNYSGTELAKRYKARVFKGVPYRFIEPLGFKKGGTKKYPLILSLHGAGGKGSDNLKNLRTWNGILSEPSFQKRYPCFVVVPQSRSYWINANAPAPDVSKAALKTYPEFWSKAIAAGKGLPSATNKGNLDQVFELLDLLATDYPIDLDRVYVLGHSMGGFGSWTAIAEAPDRFAAAIPSAGGLSPWYDVNAIAHIPIWAFHGDADTTVVVGFSRVAFEQLSEVDGNMNYTEIERVRHNVNNQAFSYSGNGATGSSARTKYSSDKCDRTRNVWAWLFKQRRHTNQ
jgi:predicted peptidase